MSSWEQVARKDFILWPFEKLSNTELLRWTSDGTPWTLVLSLRHYLCNWVLSSTLSGWRQLYDLTPSIWRRTWVQKISAFSDFSLDQIATSFEPVRTEQALTLRSVAVTTTYIRVMKPSRKFQTQSLQAHEPQAPNVLGDGSKGRTACGRAERAC